MSRADNVSGGKRADGLDSTYNDYVKIRKTTLLDSATTGRTLTFPDRDDTVATLVDIPSAATYATLSGTNLFNGPQNTFINAELVNGILFSNSTYWAYFADKTKKVTWNTSSSQPSTTLTMRTLQTTSQQLFIPDIDSTDIVATLRYPQTFEAPQTFAFTATTTFNGEVTFNGGSGLATSGTYPRTSNSNQQSSTFTTPAIVIGSTNDGIYSSGTDIVDLGAQGTNYISLQPQGIYRFVGGTIDPAIVFNQRIQALNGASGATSPAIQFDNQNSGFYRVSQGVIGIGISGVATGRWSSAGLNLFGVTGAAASPAIVLANDTTTGIYQSAVGQLAITCGSTQRLKCSSSGVNITGSTISSAPVACQMTKSLAQNISNASVTTISAYDASSNPSGSLLFSLNTGSGQITVTVTDAPLMLAFTCNGLWASSAAVGIREIWIEELGSGDRWCNLMQDALAGGAALKMTCSGSRMITSNGTYTLAFKVWQDRGASLNFGGVAASLTRFSLFRVC